MRADMIYNHNKYLAYLFCTCSGTYVRYYVDTARQNDRSGPLARGLDWMLTAKDRTGNSALLRNLDPDPDPGSGSGAGPQP